MSPPHEPFRSSRIGRGRRPPNSRLSLGRPALREPMVPPARRRERTRPQRPGEPQVPGSIGSSFSILSSWFSPKLVAASEVEVIRQVASAYGVPDEEWPSVAEALDLHISADLHLQHLTLLGLHQGASKSDVKSAYRTKVIQYHPDRVATLAPEFQELANRKTIELRVAYEELLTAFD